MSQRIATNDGGHAGIKNFARKTLMMAIYRVVYKIALFLLKFCHGWTSKLDKGYQQRQKINGVSPWLLVAPAQKPIWIHCASGEFEYALPLIREIKSKTPHEKIMVTYYTPSYVDRIKKEPLVDFSFPIPWDTPHDTVEFLKHHQPKLLLIARTDVWPEITYQCQQLKIPVALFSMTFNKKLNPLSKMIYRWRLNSVDQFFVVSDADKNILKTVVKKLIVVSGDTRYEQCLYRLQNKNLDIIKPQNLSQKIFVAGSTWPEDEKVLLPLIVKNKHHCHWIIVPHEATAAHIENISEALKKQNVKVQLLSQSTHWDGQNVLIIDKMGLLASLYSIADVSFVGGSYKRQVHSVMEPLACGSVVLVGPYCTNSREAMDFSRSTTLYSMSPVQICKASQLEETFFAALSKWNKTDSANLRQDIIKRAHVSARLWMSIQKYLQ